MKKRKKGTVVKFFNNPKRNIKKPDNTAKNTAVSAQGYYLTNPKFDMQQVLFLLGRKHNFNGLIVEGKPEDFVGFDENGNDRSRMAYRYVEQLIEIPLASQKRGINSETV